MSLAFKRHTVREQRQGHRLAEVEFLDIDPTSTVADTFRAARMLREAGAAAIVVLGGDGTHRAVVRELITGAGDWRDTAPIAGISTGTNNAFPALRESTSVGLAVGLHATGRPDAGTALATNKLLQIRIDGAEGLREDIALVDAVIADARLVGARGLRLRLARQPSQCRFRIRAPIAPGLVRDVAIADVESVLPGEPVGRGG